MIKLSTVQLGQIRDMIDWNRRNSKIKNALEMIKNNTEKKVIDGKLDDSKSQLIDLFTSINSFILSIENDP